MMQMSGLDPPPLRGRLGGGANIMFASVLFPQTEISPLEDIQ